MIRGTGGNTTVPGVAAASMEPVRTAGKDRAVAGPDAVSDARRLVVGLSWAAAAWGLAFGALGWLNLRTRRDQRWWVASVVAAVLVTLAIGLLSATGLIGRVVVG